jgi:hypothetical protein
VILASLLPLVLAAAPVTIDAVNRSVTFTARMTEVTTNAPLEFLFVGPDSDRAYEALFVTDARIQEIVSAMEKAGIPRGRAPSPADCRFWPAGPVVTLAPDCRALLSDTTEQPFLPIVATGGARTAAGTAVAETNMPSALFALYTCAQSPLLFDDALDQSAVYGRFTAARAFGKGVRQTFTLSWDGASATKPYSLALRPGEVKEALAALRAAAAPHGLDVLVSFDPQMSVQEAQAAAQALAVLDSRAVRVNGFVPGQFFYRAFLPLERWRERKERLTQPLEVRLTEAGETFTLIDEDWRVEGLDPKLTPRAVARTEACAAKVDTCFVFVPGSTPLSRLYALRASLPATFVNWYVYTE